MSELPEGWAEAPLGDIGKWASGGTPSRQKPEYFGGPIPWVKSGDLPDGPIVHVSESLTSAGVANSAAKLLPAGTIAIALYGATIGRLGILTFPAATNQACACLDVSHGLIDRRFAFYFLLSQRKALVEMGQGGAQPNISQEILRQHPILVPPLAEQRRIVEKVEALLAKVEACRQRLHRLPKLLTRFRQSVLAAAFTGDWPSTTLDQLFDIRTGGTPSRKESRYFANGTIPWVKTSEVQNGDITATEEHITEEAIASSNAKPFPPNTLLVAMYGEGRTRGQVGWLRIRAATNQACAALINEKMEDGTREFVYLFLLGQYQRLRAESFGGNQPNLNLGIIKSWEIPLPPLAEQHEIVRRVRELFALADRLEARLTQARRQVDSLTQAILAKAFRGELVPTEAALSRESGHPYESATDLLARLQSTAPAPASPKPRRTRPAK